MEVLAKTRENEQITLSANLKRYRKLRGWDQHDLAAATGLGKTTIAGYEQMTRFPSPARRRIIADALGISTGALLEEAREVPKDLFQRILQVLSSLEQAKLPDALRALEALATSSAGPTDPGRRPAPFQKLPKKKKDVGN